MLRLLSVSRVFVAMWFVGYFTADPHAPIQAAILAVLWHHFRTFDVHGDKWRCSEKFMNVVIGVVGVSGLLLGVGSTWLEQWLHVAIAVLWSFLIFGVITYPFAHQAVFICCRESTCSSGRSHCRTGTACRARTSSRSSCCCRTK